MKQIYTPLIFPDTVIGQVDDNIKNTFKTYSSDNAVMIESAWMFTTYPDVSSFIKQNQNKHLVFFSGSDSFCFEPRKILDSVQEINHPLVATLKEIVDHPAGYSLVGNVFDENYFSFWLEFVREHIDGRFEFDYNTVNIDKVYMCTNRKPHGHRIQLVRSLYDHNLQNYGLVSLGKPTIYTDTDKKNEDNIDYKGLPVPIKLEVDHFNHEGQAAVAGDVSGISSDITSLGHPDNWKRFFLSVVTETGMGHTDFLSEKTLKPILGYKPFIIMGPSAAYDILHSWGIDTFNDVLGGDYTRTDRSKTTHEYHCDKIVSLIQDLQKEDLNALYKSLLPRLIENRKNLLYAAEQNHKKIIEIAKQF